MNAATLPAGLPRPLRVRFANWHSKLNFDADALITAARVASAGYHDNGNTYYGSGVEAGQMHYGFITYAYGHGDKAERACRTFGDFLIDLGDALGKIEG